MRRLTMFLVVREMVSSVENNIVTTFCTLINLEHLCWVLLAYFVQAWAGSIDNDMLERCALGQGKIKVVLAQA